MRRGLRVGNPVIVAETAAFRAPFVLQQGTSYLVALDSRIIESVWSLSTSSNQHVERIFHAPTRHADNPVIDYPPAPTNPHDGGFPNALLVDGDTRLWYYMLADLPSGVKGVIGYAGDSVGGTNFVIPELDNHPGIDTTSLVDNISYTGDLGTGIATAAHIFATPAGASVPAAYTHLAVYGRTGGGSGGTYIVGSLDGGETWDGANATRIHEVAGDGQSSLVPDPLGGGYLLFMRSAYLYAGGGALIDEGTAERIAVARIPALFQLSREPLQTVILPDEDDYSRSYHYMYGFSCKQHASGLLIGMVPLRHRQNTTLAADLVWSDNGYDWYRQQPRVAFLSPGTSGQWDDGFVVVGPGWVERTDYWDFYYGAFDGTHETQARQPGETIPSATKRNGGIGVARVRREGLASFRFPTLGGVIETREMLWPGGGLFVNTKGNGTTARIRARVMNPDRREGGSYGVAKTGYDWGAWNASDSVNTELLFSSGDIRDLAGQRIRIDFHGEAGCDFFGMVLP